MTDGNERYINEKSTISSYKNITFISEILITSLLDMECQ